jgi:hypothetical protein
VKSANEINETAALPSFSLFFFAKKGKEKNTKGKKKEERELWRKHFSVLSAAACQSWITHRFEISTGKKKVSKKTLVAFVLLGHDFKYGQYRRRIQRGCAWTRKRLGGCVAIAVDRVDRAHEEKVPSKGSSKNDE